MARLRINGGGRSFRRERQAAVRKIVSEVYSPPRVTQEIKNGKWKHFAPGLALDITVVDPNDGKPWGFYEGREAQKGEKAYEPKPQFPFHWLPGVQGILHMESHKYTETC